MVPEPDSRSRNFTTLKLSFPGFPNMLGAVGKPLPLFQYHGTNTWDMMQVFSTRLGEDIDTNQDGKHQFLEAFYLFSTEILGHVMFG